MPLARVGKRQSAVTRGTTRVVHMVPADKHLHAQRSQLAGQDPCLQLSRRLRRLSRQHNASGLSCRVLPPWLPGRAGLWVGIGSRCAVQHPTACGSEGGKARHCGFVLSWPKVLGERSLVETEQPAADCVHWIQDEWSSPFAIMGSHEA
eukprot:6202572-Pleurochrysis_carterae.AAC.4